MSEPEKNKSNPFKFATQWLLLPALTGLCGITMTYFAFIKQISDKQIEHSKDIISNSIALVDEREQRRQADAELKSTLEDRMKNVVVLMSKQVEQQTELIALLRVQQQVK